MNITFSEIVYLLSRKHQVLEVKSAYFDAPMMSVKKYRGQVEKRQLYILSVDRISELASYPLDN